MMLFVDDEMKRLHIELLNESIDKDLHLKKKMMMMMRRNEDEEKLMRRPTRWTNINRHTRSFSFGNF